MYFFFFSLHPEPPELFKISGWIDSKWIHRLFFSKGGGWLVVVVVDWEKKKKRKIAADEMFYSALGSSLARLAWQLRHAQDTNRTVVLQKVSLLAYVY